MVVKETAVVLLSRSSTEKRLFLVLSLGVLDAHNQIIQVQSSHFICVYHFLVSSLGALDAHNQIIQV